MTSKPMPLTVIILAVAVVAFLLVKRLAHANPETAREWLNKGALVIDVRSEAEYREQHLPSAINIPLNRLAEEIARHAPKKQQPLLLHCRSGARSAKATSVLKKLGYSNVLDLGSYGRAEKIVGEQRKAGKQD